MVCGAFAQTTQEFQHKAACGVLPGSVRPGAASARPLPSDLIVAGKYFNLGTRYIPRSCIARTAHAYGALAYAKGSGNGLSYCCRSAARIEVERVLQMAMAVLRQTLFALPHDVTNNLH